MSNVELAVSCFKEGSNCAQALLSSYGIKFGLDRETAFKIAAAFGGGLGRLGETCGAVTGAFMIIGLKYGPERPKDKAAKEKVRNSAEHFIAKFKFRNGAIKCKTLLGCDISTPEGMKFAKEQNLIETLCPKFVKDAAEIIEEMI
ncbi:MAG: C_GCAxxG_C_C family protein [Ammonifex sp.]|jgi:C_GCAxxG_C_C family probable redox protein|nr:MAG: C_GCAxxG_C_C family protein [Ammonifex sp.]